jgi:hypothetical protein
MNDVRKPVSISTEAIVLEPHNIKNLSRYEHGFSERKPVLFRFHPTQLKTESFHLAPGKLGRYVQ